MRRLSDITLHPLGRGNLTSDGQQYGDEVATTDDDYKVVETVECEFPMAASRSREPLVELEMSLVAAVKSSGAAESVLYKWQYSLDNSAWADLCAEQTRAASAAAYDDVSVSGRFPTTAFASVPFWLRFVIKSGGAGGETATGKTKSSSYVRALYANND